MSNIKLLLLEDCNLDAELTLRELKRMEHQFNTRIVSEREEFEKEVIEWNPDLIISDFNLQTFNGDEALAFAKKKRPETPFITLSGSITKKMEVTLLEERANDVLTKDNLKRLPYAINRVLNEKEEQKKLKNILEELRKTNDQLSSLLKEKELLIGEVHHRVKNNLALISSFLQLEQLGVVKSESVEQIIVSNIMRIKSISIVHETVYQQGAFSNIDVLQVLEEIISTGYLEKTGKKLKIKRIASQTPITFNINTAVPFALLLSEILSQILGTEDSEAISSGTELIISVAKKKKLIWVEIQQPHLVKLAENLKEEDAFSEVIEVLAKQIEAKLQVDPKKGVIKIIFSDRDSRGSSSTLKA